VDGAAIAEARAAGIDQVLARSGFVQLLPSLLQQQKSAASNSAAS
jgi:hypothetical protein